jgi:NADH:ubiquinone oxidoreductase subunit 6 (subunit J)
MYLYFIFQFCRIYAHTRRIYTVLAANPMHVQLDMVILFSTLQGLLGTAAAITLPSGVVFL